jgi:DMSO/TMAO reductase YedYZ molybdopterin-dependent catalytic subunit
MTEGNSPAAGTRHRTGGFAGAICGVLAAAVSVGIGQLLAGLSVPAASPVIAVGQAAIGLTPAPVSDWAKQNLGTNDKNVLLAGVVIVLLIFAGVIGTFALRRLAYGFAGLGVLAVVGLAAALTRSGANAGYAFPTLVGAVVSAFALTWLVHRARDLAAASAPEPAPLPRITFGEPEDLRPPDLPGAEPPARPPAGATAPRTPPRSPLLGIPDRPAARRSFLVASGATLAAAAVGEYAGRELSTRKNVSAAQAAVRLPRPAVPAPPLPAGVNLPVPGISSFITPNSQFYRVDTAILLPEVDPASWSLRIHGMVDHPMTVTFDDLLRRPLIEDYITLACVSNPVSGPYVGNAKWLGASLASLLKEAGIQSRASQLLCTSTDGFTSGAPVSVVMDGRDALVAVAMNGTALPVAHGFPARLVVPGLYGYVSACKWVTDINVTTFADASAYWVQQGWSQQAPIKTESRIDVPASGSGVKAGRVAVAGVAWAQHKGIEAVEVRVDNGPWHEATLAAVPGVDSWRQWVWYWDAAPGSHTISARATDKTGYTQTALQVPTAPNGASGYPVNTVSVS